MSAPTCPSAGKGDSEQSGLTELNTCARTVQLTECPECPGEQDSGLPLLPLSQGLSVTALGPSQVSLWTNTGFTNTEMHPHWGKCRVRFRGASGHVLSINQYGSWFLYALLFKDTLNNTELIYQY